MGKYQIKTTEEFENKICPEGVHDMRITMTDDHKKSANGDWMAKVEFEVVDGPNAGLTATDYILIYEPISPSVGGMWKTRVFLKCIGEPHKGTPAVNTENWYRKQVKVRVEWSVFKGKTSAKIAEYIVPKDDETPLEDPRTETGGQIPF